MKAALYARVSNNGGTDAIKTLPTFLARGRIDEFLSASFCRFYFTLGLGRPKRNIDRLFFTHRGIILGCFPIEEIVQNVGQLPKLTRLDGRPSSWQIRPDRWVAVCVPPFVPLGERLYFAAFRGWRYFDLETYRQTLDAKVHL